MPSVAGLKIAIENDTLFCALRGPTGENYLPVVGDVFKNYERYKVKIVELEMEFEERENIADQLRYDFIEMHKNFTSVLNTIYTGDPGCAPECRADRGGPHDYDPVNDCDGAIDKVMEIHNGDRGYYVQRENKKLKAENDKLKVENEQLKEENGRLKEPWTGWRHVV